MKKMVYMFAAALVATAALGCPAEAASVEGTTVIAAAKAPKGEIKTVVFSTDLHCQKCVNKINDNLAFEKGVKDLKVDLKTHHNREIRHVQDFRGEACGGNQKAWLHGHGQELNR